MNYRRFPLGPLWTNGYLFWDKDKVAFFVDPGGDPQDVIDWIKRENLSLKSIILTHGHADHIAGASKLIETFGCDLMIHRLDEPMLSQGEKNLSIHLGTECPAVAATGYLADGDRFSIGTMDLRVIHTPGHTMGSCCLMLQDDEESILITGDTLFARSIGRTDLPGSVPDLMDRSLKLFMDMDDDLPVLPGHGPETSIRTEKRENPFLS